MFYTTLSTVKTHGNLNDRLRISIFIRNKEQEMPKSDSLYNNKFTNMKQKPLQEELTTAMHSEFMDEEFSELDMRVMGVYGAMVRGASMADALAKYEMTEEIYLANVERVLNS